MIYNLGVRIFCGNVLSFAMVGVFTNNAPPLIHNYKIAHVIIRKKNGNSLVKVEIISEGAKY